MKLKLSSALLFILSAIFFVSCEREISFENGGSTPIGGGNGGNSSGTAIYTFNGGTGTCTGAVINGTYTAGTALTAANTAVITVLVDSVGTYTLSTGTSNGITFSGTGTFTATGSQQITLTGSGTPVAAGTSNFTPGTNGCSFSITVTGGSSNTTGNFKAKIDGTQWVADKAAQGARMNGIINISGLGIDKKVITMTLTDSGVHEYTLYYDGAVAKNVGAFTDSNSTSSVAFATNAGSASAITGGKVNITSIDETNKTMTGTFSFKAIRQLDNTTKTITEGSFTNVPYITSLPSTGSSDTLTVKVDGSPFLPVSISGISVFGTINLSGSDASATRSVGLSLTDNVTPGTYSLGPIGSAYTGQYNANATTYLNSSTGTITILEHNTITKRIRGNFSFSAVELLGTTTAQITEGYFAITYQ